MKKGVLVVVVVVVILAVVIGLLVTRQSGGNTIKLGAIQPISGQVSAYGTQTRDAINLAIEEINAKGGVLGKQLEMIVEDDEASPDKSMNALKKLVAKDKIVGFIGALTSKCSLAITKYAQDKKVIMITPSSTNDTVTDAGDFIFRACYKDSFQGQVVAQFALETLKAKKAAVLYDITNDYSKGLTTNFSDKFKALGGEVVATESYSANDKDFNAQLTKIKAAKPDVLFIPDYYSTVSLIAKQVRTQGLTIPMVGADGWDEITNNAGDEVLNCYYSNHYSPEADDPDVKSFVKKFKDKYNIEPNALAALGYDAAYILAEAIERAGSTNSEKVRDAMMETNRKFVTGNISFDENRNPVKSAVMLKIVKGADGKLTTQYAGTVNP
ncbi:MAG: ABC transporter substrate-binding protein [Firmicutes bacterium]|nr:ABC transporter substrate-binding protein [Bacillota bacterium]